ncbi:hypothetical protein [Lactobacillus taiwanensis]|uniref:hypothetical protein n=2 Tax=Lactobacillus TaxID=1578 RepID=UPI0025B20C72|nr:MULTISPECIES: hypothetical protein [Lactobacillus]
MVFTRFTVRGLKKAKGQIGIALMALNYEEIGRKTDQFLNNRSKGKEPFENLGIHFLVWMKIPCPIFLYKKEAFAVPSLYNQFTTKIMKEG